MRLKITVSSKKKIDTNDISPSRKISPDIRNTPILLHVLISFPSRSRNGRVVQSGTIFTRAYSINLFPPTYPETISSRISTRFTLMAEIPCSKRRFISLDTCLEECHSVPFRNYIISNNACSVVETGIRRK